MTRYVGIKNSSIYIVSDKVFSNSENSGLKVVPVPEHLNHLSSEELITNVKYLNDEFKYKFEKKEAKDLKVAFVSNFAMQCGISSYSSFLYKELIPLVGDYRLLIESHDEYLDSLYEIDNLELNKDKVIPCWKRGEKLDNLISEIKKFNPDIVLIQHEFGLWSNARYWISLMSQLSNYRVIVTMHSVFHHKDKTIVEACIPEIIVHLDGAKKVLKEEKKVSGQVHVIPHGCFPCLDSSKLWNFYKSNNTFIQAGFLFRYKGFENSIRAVSLLKNKYPDIFFTAICSEGPFSKVEHEIYYNELVELVNSLHLQNNVGFIRGYQSDEVLDAYLRTNKAAVLPYTSNKEHECYGASGFGPFFMTKGIPLITSNAHHFEGLPSLKANSSEEIAYHLDNLFSSDKLISNQIDIQNQYLLKNSWNNVALRYLSIFEN